MNHRIFYLVAVFFSVLIFKPCPSSALEINEKNSKISVATTIVPLAEFVKQIGGERVLVTVMVPAAANEHTYEPTPNQLKALSGAQLYVAAGSGVEFELAWLDRFKQLNQSMQFCDTSEGVPLISGGESHHHERHDPHIWLSPENAKLMVRQIANALSKIDKANQSFYENNFARYVADLKTLQREVKELISGKKGKYFISSHSAWRYFAKEYGLNEIAIEADGKEPSASQILNIIKMAKQHQIRSIFVALQFSKRNAETIAKEIGGNLIEADPTNGAYIQNLRQFAKNLAEFS